MSLLFRFLVISYELLSTIVLFASFEAVFDVPDKVRFTKHSF